MHLYWIISLRILPFIDLPFHLAESTILKDLYNSSLCFSDYYSIPTLIKSNIFHMVFCSLNIFPTVEFANKVYYIFYIIIFPLSSLILISYIKGNKWFSLFTFLFIYNHSVHWGFTGFTMSVPFIILFILFIIKYFENPSLLNIIILMFLLLLIFSMHFQNAIFCILIFSAGYIINLKKNVFFYVKYIFIILPVLCIMYYAYTFDTTGPNQNLFPFLIDYYKNDYLASIPERIKVLAVMDNFYFVQGPWGAFFAVIFVMSFVFPILVYLYRRSKKVYDLIQTDNYSWYLYVFISSSFLCYFFLPNIIPGQNIVFERFTVFLMLALIIYGAYSYKGILLNKIARISVVSIVLFHFILVSFYFNDFRNESAAFNKDLLPDNATCKRISGIIYSNTFKNRPVYIHFPMYFIVWKKGISTGLVDYRFGVIKRKADFDKLPYYREWIGDQRDYSDEYKNIEYILLKDSLKLDIKGFDITKQSNDWYLYTNRNPK